MKEVKKSVHFTDRYLLEPTNPVTVNLIGAGGTGSHVLSTLARTNFALRQLGHAGLFVRVFDGDTISTANLGRQLFSNAEVGLNKGVALVNRFNRIFGTGWKAVPERYDTSLKGKIPMPANLTVSCVDTAQARFEIAAVLQSLPLGDYRDKPMYWMDFGNSRYTGQVLLSTIGDISQPASKKFRTVARLPLITEEFKHLLLQQQDNNDPSCSFAEAITKQDLFINSSLADLGASLLWQLFREGMTENRGFFHNIKDFRTQPLKIA